MAAATMTIGPGTLTIGEAGSLTNLAPQCTSCKITPSTSQSDATPVLSGETVAGDRTETWELEAALNHDLGAAESVQRWLFEHRGEIHPFTFVPESAATATVSGSLVVEALPFGGDVGSKANDSIKCPLIGAPSLD